MIPIRAEVVGSAPNDWLELRIEEPPEQPRAAVTDDASVMVPWPLDPLKTAYFYLSSPWLSAIGNLLADATASARWELVAREVDTEGNLITRAPGYCREQDEDYARAYAWLSRPDVGGDGVSVLDLPGLLRAMCTAYDQNGNVFVEIVRDRAATRPVRIQHLLPQYVHYRARGGQLELYQIDPWRGEYAFVPFGQRARGDQTAREYIHQRAANTLSSYYGIPQWYPSKQSVEVDNEHRRYLRGFFQRHTTPRYLIEITQDPAWTGAMPGEEQVDSVFAHIRSFLNANAGDMAGRNLIIRYPGGILVRATPLDNKLEDPTFPNTSKSLRDEILAVRHISLFDIGNPEGTNRATAQERSDNFRATVLAPFAAPAVAIINRVLHAPEPHGLGVSTYEFVLNWERVDDLLSRIEAVVRAVGGPVLTPPEGRQLLGYESRGEDVLYMPTNMIPSDEWGESGPDAEPSDAG
jgi:phage portal protein BeeE